MQEGIEQDFIRDVKEIGSFGSKSIQNGSFPDRLEDLMRKGSDRLRGHGYQERQIGS